MVLYLPCAVTSVQSLMSNHPGSARRKEEEEDIFLRRIGQICVVLTRSRSHDCIFMLEYHSLRHLDSPARSRPNLADQGHSCRHCRISC